MKHTTSKRLSFIAAAAFALTSLTQRSEAVATLSLFDGTTTINVTDGGGNDSNVNVGAVTYNGSIGIWQINVSTGLTKPIIGSPMRPDMDLNSVDFSTGAGTLVITFTDTDFTLPFGSAIAAIGGTQNGGNSTIRYETYQITGTSTNLLTSVGTLTSTPFAASASGNLIGTEGSYSLRQVVTITHTAAGTSSFDASLQVPDGGATAALLGLGLVAVEGIRRKLKAA